MERAWKILVTTIFVCMVVYVLGIIIYEKFFPDILQPAAERLAPYGIEIMHLR